MTPFHARVVKLEGNKALFVPPLPQSERHWLVKRMVDRSKSAPDAESTTTKLLKNGKDIAAKRLSKDRMRLVDDLSRPKRNVIRANIVYSVLGFDPDAFLSGPADDVLGFIVEHRLQDIQRVLAPSIGGGTRVDWPLFPHP
jgi:hypothetical protein